MVSILSCLHSIFNHLREKTVNVRNNGIHYELFAPRTVLHPRTFLTIEMRVLHSIFMWHSLFIMLYKVVLTF